MARSPLFHRLQRLAARQWQASRSGLAAEEPAARRPAQTLDRRHWLRLAGGGVAAGWIGAPAWASGWRGPRYGERVVVIGAGLAGLTAAYRLHQAGVTAEVYEGAHGVGGRVRTNRHSFAAGQRVERGGELIDTGHVAYRKLILELDLALDDLAAAEPAGTEPLYYFDDAPYTEAQASADFQAVLPALARDLYLARYPTTYFQSTPHGRALDQTSITDWIESRVPGGLASNFGQLLDVAYNIEYGAESSVQSALNLIYLLGFGNRPGTFHLFGESDERYRVAGGNDLVPAELSRRLAGQIQVDQRLVAAVTLADGRTRFTFRSGGATQEVIAEQAVLTVPFAVLREQVDLSRLQLSPRKRTAIAELRMGTNSKLHLQFRTRLWNALGQNGETFADTGYQNTWEETLAQGGAEGILNNYTGGKIGASFDRGSPTKRAELFLRQIEPLLPGIGGQWNGLATLDYWPGSPFQLGSYSYWRVGQYTAFAGAEGESEGNVHFAGEHASINFQGYMNGAVETGQRAARAVLRALL